MREPVQRIRGKSLGICAGILLGIVLVEVVCAYAFIEDFSFNLGAEGVVQASGEESGIRAKYEAIGFDIDPNAVEGMIDPSEKTGVLKDYGDIAYKINPQLDYKNGKASANVMIENHGDNQHVIRVQFEIKETGEIVYQSGYIAPDMHIPTAKLDVELDDGEYDATAIIEVYDTDTQEYLGKLEQDITISVGK